MPLETRARRRGLTLLELLVVLASVAIGAAILFPLFTNRREAARASSCQSNLKQIGLGFMQHSRDYDEMLPRPVYENPRVVWQQVLLPYVKSTSLFVCPSNTSALEPPLVSSLPPAIPRSYAMNHRLSIRASQWESGYNSVKSPARKIMVAESRAADPDYGSAWWKPAQWKVGFAGHDGRANYLFADAHVKALKPSETAAPLNMWGGMDNGVCWNRSINCELLEPEVAASLRQLEQEHGS